MNRIKAGLDVGTAELLRRKNGEGTISNGYHALKVPGKKLNYMHRIIVERVLGHALPEKAVIHHVDGNGSNNENTNLVVCENQKYHLLIHKRQDALVACGNANWIKCGICKSYDDPHNMYVYQHGASFSAYHKECSRIQARKRKAKLVENLVP